MANQMQFSEQIKYYLAQGIHPTTGARPSQADLASTIGINISQLSRKLSGQAPLSSYEAASMVKALAQYGSLTTRQEARELLGLMDCPDFTPAQWQAGALELLKDKPLQPSVAATPAPVIEQVQEQVTEGVAEPDLPEKEKFGEYTRLRQHKEKLLDKLMDCSSMSSMGQLEVLVRQLPKSIQRKIDYLDVANLTRRVTLVVDACMSEEGNGLEILIRRMAFFDRGTTAFNQLLAFLKANEINLTLD